MAARNIQVNCGFNNISYYDPLISVPANSVLLGLLDATQRKAGIVNAPLSTNGLQSIDWFIRRMLDGSDAYGLNIGLLSTEPTLPGRAYIPLEEYLHDTVDILVLNGIDDGYGHKLLETARKIHFDYTPQAQERFMALVGQARYNLFEPYAVEETRMVMKPSRNEIKSVSSDSGEFSFVG